MATTQIEEGDTIHSEVETVMGEMHVTEHVVDEVDEEGVYSYEETVLGTVEHFVSWEALGLDVWEVL